MTTFCSFYQMRLLARVLERATEALGTSFGIFRLPHAHLRWRADGA